LFIALLLLIHATPSAAAAIDEPLDCLIEPYVIVNVGSGVAGLLDSVQVDRGDRVKKGQIVATLDARVEKATIELHRARATMQSTIKAGEVRLEMSRAQSERNEGLFRRALISADDMDEFKTNKRLAEYNLLEAQDTKRLAELELQRGIADLARHTIRSPINGVVVKRFLSAGERVEQEPIAQLAQLDPLHVEVFAPVALLNDIAVGMRAEVRPQAPLNSAHTARVTVVDRVVDAASSTFGVRLELPNRDNRLPAGLKCTVRFLRQ
jgi:RND family efflux transporter MFP subunit